MVSLREVKKAGARAVVDEESDMVFWADSEYFWTHEIRFQRFSRSFLNNSIKTL
jgi:hypothetical protein